jgi:5'(3')-deoxyribonucleotidase
LEACAKAVGRENVCIATSPTKCPESLAGKLEWIHDHFPEWMHRQYAITPRKHLFARPDSLLIDDYSENVERFKAHSGHAILVPRPWNDNWGSDPRNYLEEKLEGLSKNLRRFVSIR